MTESVAFMNLVYFLLSTFFFFFNGSVSWLCICVYKTHLSYHLPKRQWIYYSMNKAKWTSWRLSLDLYLGLYYFFLMIRTREFYKWLHSSTRGSRIIAQLSYFSRVWNSAVVCAYSTIQKITAYCLDFNTKICFYIWYPSWSSWMACKNW